MQPCGLEFRPAHSKSVDQNTGHQSGFLLLGVVGAVLEEFAVVVALDGPARHCKAKLDISLDFSSVGSSIEQPEFNSAFGEIGVKIDTMIPGLIVVRMVNRAVVAIIGCTVPHMLGSVPTLLSTLLHSFQQLRGDFVAPSVGSASNLQRLVEQILSSGSQVQQSSEAFGCVVGTIHMDMDSAGGVCHGTSLNQLSDDVLEVFDVFILENRRNNLTGIIRIGSDDAPIDLFLGADASVTRSEERL